MLAAIVRLRRVRQEHADAPRIVARRLVAAQPHLRSPRRSPMSSKRIWPLRRSQVSRTSRSARFELRIRSPSGARNATSLPLGETSTSGRGTIHAAAMATTIGDRAEPSASGRASCPATTGRSPTTGRARRRHRRQNRDGAGPIRDPMRDPQQRVAAPAHRLQRPAFEAERHQQQREGRGRHDPERRSAAPRWHWRRRRRLDRRSKWNSANGKVARPGDEAGDDGGRQPQHSHCRRRRTAWRPRSRPRPSPAAAPRTTGPAARTPRPARTPRRTTSGSWRRAASPAGTAAPANAAHATSCSEIGERSRMMARNAMPAMISERWVGVVQPASPAYRRGRQDRQHRRPLLHRIAQRHRRHERQREAQPEKNSPAAIAIWRPEIDSRCASPRIAHGVEIGGAQCGLVTDRQRDRDRAGRLRQWAADALRDRGARGVDLVGDGQARRRRSGVSSGSLRIFRRPWPKQVAPSSSKKAWRLTQYT